MIEPARWATQATSIHLFKPDGYPNAVTVCLIGNFEKRRVPRSMMVATADLTRAMVRRFAMPPERITTHRGIDGRLTQCPGKHFSLKRLRRMVREKS